MHVFCYFYFFSDSCRVWNDCSWAQEIWIAKDQYLKSCVSGAIVLLKTVYYFKNWGHLKGKCTTKKNSHTQKKKNWKKKLTKKKIPKYCIRPEKQKLGWMFKTCEKNFPAKSLTEKKNQVKYNKKLMKYLRNVIL